MARLPSPLVICADLVPPSPALNLPSPGRKATISADGHRGTFAQVNATIGEWRPTLKVAGFVPPQRVNRTSPGIWEREEVGPRVSRTIR